MADSSLAIQGAVWAALDAALSVPVFDHVPENQSPMFVVIGAGASLPDDVKSKTGVEQTIEIDVFSDARGMKETKQVMRTIYDTLHRQSLTVTGFDALPPQFEFSDTFIDPDGARGVLRLSIKTKPT